MEIYSTGKTQCFCSCSVAGDASALFCTKRNTIQKRHGIYMGKKKQKQVHNVEKRNDNDKW